MLRSGQDRRPPRHLSGRRRWHRQSRRRHLPGGDHYVACRLECKGARAGLGLLQRPESPWRRGGKYGLRVANRLGCVQWELSFLCEHGFHQDSMTFMLRSQTKSLSVSARGLYWHPTSACYSRTWRPERPPRRSQERFAICARSRAVRLPSCKGRTWDSPAGSRLSLRPSAARRSMCGARPPSSADCSTDVFVQGKSPPVPRGLS